MIEKIGSNLLLLNTMPHADVSVWTLLIKVKKRFNICFILLQAEGAVEINTQFVN